MMHALGHRGAMQCKTFSLACGGVPEDRFHPAQLREMLWRI
jgi:hypothetical protein